MEGETKRRNDGSEYELQCKRLTSFFFLVYFAQNAFLSYYSFLNSVYLRESKLSFSKIGIFSFISLLPLMLKVIVGVLSDHSGKRKIYIFCGIVIQAASLIAISFVSPATEFGGFLALMLFVIFGVSLYDTTTDALAITVSTNQHEEASIQASMGVGNACGNILVTAVLGIVAQQIGWNFVFYTLAFITFIPLFGLFQVKEPSQTQLKGRFQLKHFKALLRIEVIALLAYSILFGMTTYGFAGIIFPNLVENFDATVVEVGMYATMLSIGNGMGVILCKLSLYKLSYMQASVIAPLLHCLMTLGLLLISNKTSAWAIIFFLGVTWGNRNTVFLSVSMHFTEKAIAASMYSVIMAGANLGIASGNWLSSALVDAYSFTTAYIVIASLNVLGAAVVLLMFRKQKYLQLFGQESNNINEKEELEELNSDSEPTADELELS